MPVSWRASGRYTANNTSRGALLLETQAFLLAYGDAAGDLRARADAARLTLLNTVLQEHARESRATTVGRIRERLIQWEPPDWVLDDLVAFARLPELDHLKAALLLHLCRRDALLYDLVQNVVAPRWSTGGTTVNNDHVQQFLDAATPAHAEILGWRYETRNKLVSNSLGHSARLWFVDCIAPPGSAAHHAANCAARRYAAPGTAAPG